MMAVASTSCEPVTDAGVRYVAIAEDGTVVATMAEYIIGSLESMQSATTSDGGRTWTNADKTYRKAGNESVQIPRGIYAIQIFTVELVHALDDGLHQLACGGVVGVLGDGHHADALAPENGLEAIASR